MIYFSILLCDRVNCNKKKETSELSNTSTSASKGGLEFLMTDPGVREQVIPAMGMSDLKLDLGTDFGIGTTFTVKGIETEQNFILKGVDERFWRDYFELARINGEEITQKKMKKMKQVVDEKINLNDNEEIEAQTSQNSNGAQVMDEIPTYNYLEGKIKEENKEENNNIIGLENINFEGSSNS
uniref:Uncharacterized protein n=1 Tax=Meloidogyne javanica TaxID=6303 RepID=A0A915M4Q3_MELJA